MGVMAETSHDAHTKLSRPGASDAVAGIGWRYILGEFRTEVLTGSLPLAADVAARAAAEAGAVQGHLRIDVRADRVIFLAGQTAAVAWVTPLDVELAHRISAVAGEFRLTTQPGSVQMLEIGIDAMDMAKIRPFWQAVLGYADEPGRPAPPNGLVDPVGQGPGLVPADGRAAAAAQPHPLRRVRAARRGPPADRGHDSGGRHVDL